MFASDSKSFKQFLKHPSIKRKSFAFHIDTLKSHHKTNSSNKGFSQQRNLGRKNSSLCSYLSATEQPSYEWASKMVSTNLIVLGAQGWEGFQTLGKGYILIEPDGFSNAWSSFVPHHAANKQEEPVELQTAIELYNPKTQIVVALAGSYLIYVLEPCILPEQCFDELRGRADEFMAESGGAL
jgi:hypothetical protein